MTDFAGQGAIVTGGASGIGRAVAELLAERGASVVIADRNRERVRQVAAEINTNVGRTATLAVAVDLTLPDEVGTMVSQARQFLPTIDILANIAAVQVATGRCLTSIQMPGMPHWRTTCVAFIWYHGRSSLSCWNRVKVRSFI